METVSLRLAIGYFGKYHNTPRPSPQILRQQRFCFLSGPLLTPREIGNNAYANVGGQTMSIMEVSGVAHCLLYRKYEILSHREN